MRVDHVRIKGFLMEIRKNSQALNDLIEQNDVHPDSLPLNAAKYILIELAEAMANCESWTKPGRTISTRRGISLKSNSRMMLREELQ